MQRDSLYTFINQLGEEIAPPVYQEIRPFRFGYAPVRMNDYWGLIDTSGEVVYPMEMNHPAHIMYEDFIRICVNGNWAVLNAELKLKCKLIYDFIDSEGRAFLNGQVILLGR